MVWCIRPFGGKRNKGCEKRRKVIKEIQNKLFRLVISSILISAIVIMVTI